jgi:hypothetical protein
MLCNYEQTNVEVFSDDICESRLDDKRAMHEDRIGETNRYYKRRM